MSGGAFFIWVWAALVAVWLIGLASVVAFRMVSGRISLRGLFTESMTNQPAFISRPQLLIVTLSGATAFVVRSFAAVGTTNQFPEVPATLLAAIGGSHVIYLGGRGIAAFLSSYLSPGGRR